MARPSPRLHAPLRPLRVGLLLAAALLALNGCEPSSREVYEVLEPQGTPRFPLEPHVVTPRAHPTPDMLTERPLRPLVFSLLDKRTLKVHHLLTNVGEVNHGPWGGTLTVKAFVSDLQVRDGQALHGPEGHVNPAVWVVLDDGQQKIIHEGWLFSRDQALTAWDHLRFDISFLGLEPEPLPEAPVLPTTDATDGADGEIPNFPGGPLLPAPEGAAELEEEKTG